MELVDDLLRSSLLETHKRKIIYDHRSERLDMIFSIDSDTAVNEALETALDIHIAVVFNS
jgi:hypothetical protein